MTAPLLSPSTIRIDVERPKDCPEGSELEAVVVDFALQSRPGDEGVVVLTDGAAYRLTRTTSGVYTDDLDEAFEAASRIPAEDLARFRAAVGRARVDAARFLLKHGDADDRRLAARFAFGLSRRTP